MRSVAETFIRWHVLFNDFPSLSILKKAVATGDDVSPCIAGLRSVCWKVFLLFGEFDPSRWQKTLANSRSAYSALREHFLHSIEHPDEVDAADPLTDDQNSPWVTLRQDEILRAEIQQDVERCMPEIPYFRQLTTQRLLLDVLFIFCKLNPDIGYRQGMHELLAPVLWVVEKDAIEPKSLRRHRGSDGSDGLLRDILDAQYIEHDVFTLFSLIMQTARTFYELGEREKTVSSPGSGLSINSQQESPIIERSQRIHQDYLTKVDPELAEKLAAMEILPQIFLIRWIRLLFGRELSFDQLLRLWDALFAEDPGLDLIDLICVAMLLRVRWQLVRADYSSALAILLRYPSSSSKSYGVSFVQDALYLKNNLNVAAGSHIILKHSGKSPAPRPQLEQGSAHPSMSQTADKSGSKGTLRTRPPLRPARYSRTQGIDALLQDAAKAVYEQGERWGVNKAVRDAMDEVRRNMQGLQSAATSPRPSVDTIRWSLDEGKHVLESPTATARSLEDLERRNKSLARTLDDVLKEFHNLELDLTKEKELTTAFELAMTKLRSVKDCLEDSLIALPGAEMGVHKSIEDSGEAAVSPSTRISLESVAISRLKDSTPTPAVPTEEISPGASIVVPSTPTRIPSTPKPSNITPAGSPPIQAPRPTLAESPFAWILGESDLRSNFIASVPTPATERRRSKIGKNGYLFGDSADEWLQNPESGPDGDSLSLNSFGHDSVDG